MISSRAKRILSFTGGTINLAKGNTDGMAYLVPQGQKVVIEAEGGGRNCVILGATTHSRSQRRWELMPTFPAVLEISESKGRESPLMSGKKGRELTYHAQD
jgi:hypothetical protein